MTKKIRFNVLSAVTTVASTLEDSKFKFKADKEFNKAVDRLDRYFGTKSFATCFLCSMISYYFDNQGEAENRILSGWWSEFSFTAESSEAQEWMTSHISGSKGESRANKRIS